MTMGLSAKGLDLIKHFEGCSLVAYPDPATKAEPFTIGYGHTGNVKMGDVISQEQAESFLRTDLKIFVDAVNGLLTKSVSQGQFDALVSFAYNCGAANLARSTLLSLVNTGSSGVAGPQFLRWDKAAGKQMAGLTRRRTAEMQLFEGVA